MSSGFVSSGTNDAPVTRDAAWLEAEKQLEAARARKAQLARAQDGKSLYEVLQENKSTVSCPIDLRVFTKSVELISCESADAKQTAFEEAAKLKNQFRALDEDEVEFLDSVLESSRKQEAEVRREEQRGLEEFRKRRVAETSGDADEENKKAEEVEDWVVGGARKRRRGKEKDSGGIGIAKLRKSSSATTENTTVVTKSELKSEEAEKAPNAKAVSSSTTATVETKKDFSPAPTSTKQPTKSLGLGLDYGSDDDD